MYQNTASVTLERAALFPPSSKLPPPLPLETRQGLRVLGRGGGIKIHLFEETRSWFSAGIPKVPKVSVGVIDGRCFHEALFLAFLLIPSTAHATRQSMYIRKSSPLHKLRYSPLAFAGNVAGPGKRFGCPIAETIMYKKKNSTCLHVRSC